MSIEGRLPNGSVFRFGRGTTAAQIDKDPRTDGWFKAGANFYDSRTGGRVSIGQRLEAELVVRRLATSVAGVMVEQAREIMWGMWEVNPRDTTHSSNNWRISVGLVSGEIDGSKKSPSNSLQKESVRNLEGYKVEDGEIFISNPVDYVGMVDDDGYPGLNAGWSPQASAGWIERVIERAMAYTRQRLGNL